MLRTLRIRNLAIIEDLTVEFGSGLNLLTGETGAGKSILVDALGLLSGARADRALVRTGEERLTVEALFEFGAPSSVNSWSESTGIEPEDGQLLVRREVAAQGSGRVLINGSPATLGLLRDLAGHALELHGQNEQRSLLDAGTHLEILDRFGKHQAAARDTRAAWSATREASERLGGLRDAAGGLAERQALLLETVREIDEIQPRPGELEDLDRERRLLQNASQVADLLNQVVDLSYEAEPCAASLASLAAARAQELAEIDPSLGELAARMRSAAVELQDAGASMRDYRDRTDFDPDRLETLEARKASLERLCLSRATDEAGLLELADKVREELRTLGSIDDEIAAGESALARAEDDYLAATEVLGQLRRNGAEKLTAAVEGQFGALALSKARFSVGLSPASGPAIERAGRDPRPLSATGAERVSFLLSANPGEPLRALAQVASGGELSRVMLALHVVAETSSRDRAIVFDEVDSGVGGAVADAIGARLGKLARQQQVLCITHLPQIAAHADRHYRVRKRVADGRTRAGIVRLSGDERVEELARMLGGRVATKTSRSHASELLNAAGRATRPRARSEA